MVLLCYLVSPYINLLVFHFWMPKFWNHCFSSIHELKFLWKRCKATDVVSMFLHIDGGGLNVTEQLNVQQPTEFWRTVRRTSHRNVWVSECLSVCDCVRVCKGSWYHESSHQRLHGNSSRIQSVWPEFERVGCVTVAVKLKVCVLSSNVWMLWCYSSGVGAFSTKNPIAFKL